MKYCIDTSFFIESWKHYPHDVFPSYWDKVATHIKAGDLISVDVVFEEIDRIDDDLKQWIKPHKKMFRELDMSIMLSVKEILGEYPRIVEQGKEKTQADVFVIALARTNSITVVTEEKPTKKFGIPQVCDFYSVQCINTIQLIRNLGFRF